VFEAAVEVSRLLLTCRGRRRSVKAAVEVLWPPSKLRLLSGSGRCRGVEAAVEVFDTAVNVSRPPSRRGGCRRGVETVVEV
jgi:hypothetical protein